MHGGWWRHKNPVAKAGCCHPAKPKVRWRRKTGHSGRGKARSIDAVKPIIAHQQATCSEVERPINTTNEADAMMNLPASLHRGDDYICLSTAGVAWLVIYLAGGSGKAVLKAKEGQRIVSQKEGRQTTNDVRIPAACCISSFFVDCSKSQARTCIPLPLLRGSCAQQLDLPARVLAEHQPCLPASTTCSTPAPSALAAEAAPALGLFRLR